MRSKLFCLFCFTISYDIYAQSPARHCTTPGLIALTFDDGVTKNYPELLNILDTMGVKATFFIEGQVAAERTRKPWLIDAYKRGHEIGNHTWTHPHMITNGSAIWDTEIGQPEKLIDSITGYVRKNRFMRPPHGEFNADLLTYLKDRGNTVVMWNIELTGDWKRGKKARSRAQLWSSFVHGFRDADPKKDSFILLQHDKSVESIRLVPDVVMLAQNKGFKVVSLSECLLPRT